MDIASVLGLILCFALMIFGILWGNDVSAIFRFVDVASMLITFGGSFMCILASYPLKGFVDGLKSITLIFKTSTMNVPEIIQKIIDLSNVARKEGLLSLEEAAEDIEDSFFKERYSSDCRRYRSGACARYYGDGACQRRRSS